MGVLNPAMSRDEMVSALSGECSFACAGLHLAACDAEILLGDKDGISLLVAIDELRMPGALIGDACFRLAKGVPYLFILLVYGLKEREIGPTGLLGVLSGMVKINFKSLAASLDKKYPGIIEVPDFSRRLADITSRAWVASGPFRVGGKFRTVSLAERNYRFDMNALEEYASEFQGVITKGMPAHFWHPVYGGLGAKIFLADRFGNGNDEEGFFPDLSFMCAAMLIALGFARSWEADDTPFVVVFQQREEEYRPCFSRQEVDARLKRITEGENGSKV